MSQAMAKVDLEGVDGIVADNVRQFLTLSTLPCTTRPSEVRRLFRRALPQIAEALEPFGYYRPEIEPNLDFSDAACWRASFRIRPGDPVLLQRVVTQVDGMSHARIDELIRNTPLRNGEVFEHQLYETFREKLLRLALDSGFLDATYTVRSVEVNEAKTGADITLTLRTGERYRIGTINNDVDFLNDQLMQRLVSITSGDWVERRQLGVVQQELVRSGYFSAVEIQSEPVADARLDISILATKQVPRELSVGAGVSSDLGIYVSSDYSNRLLNRRGHQFNGHVQVGTTEQEGQVEYRMPGGRPLLDWYSVYLGAKVVDSNDAIRTSAFNVGVRSSRSKGKWRVEPFLGLTLDRSDEPDRRSDLLALVPGVSFGFRQVKEGIRATGLTAQLEVAGASSSIISDATFARVSARAKTIFRVYQESRIILRGEAGYLQTATLERVPTNWRFFAGGDQSVRGFAYRTLGPTNADNEASGGEWLATGSVEFDIPVASSWSAAWFFDAGNVGTQGKFGGTWPTSTGFGVRWYSPLGPLRLDLALPLQGSEDTFRIHFNLGPDL